MKFLGRLCQWVDYLAHGEVFPVLPPPAPAAQEGGADGEEQQGHDDPGDDADDGAGVEPLLLRAHPVHGDDDGVVRTGAGARAGHRLAVVGSGGPAARHAAPGTLAAPLQPSRKVS